MIKYQIFNMGYKILQNMSLTVMSYLQLTAHLYLLLLLLLLLSLSELSFLWCVHLESISLFSKTCLNINFMFCILDYTFLLLYFHNTLYIFLLQCKLTCYTYLLTCLSYTNLINSDLFVCIFFLQQAYCLVYRSYLM